MFIQENKLLIRKYVDAYNQDWRTALNHFMVDENLRQLIKTCQSAFPKHRIVAKEMLAEADKVVLRAEMVGKHQGVFKAIQPTGYEICVPFVFFCQLAGGKIIASDLITNHLIIIEQLMDQASMRS